VSLDHAILGFLSYGPLSGYDLKSFFDISVQHFWPADQSQIYRTLARLVQQGFVEMEVIEQEDRPDRKVHSITASGREELYRWVLESSPSRQERVAKLVQIFFAGKLSNGQVLSLLREMAAHCKRSIAALDAVPNRTQALQSMPKVSPRERYFWGLTLEYGQHMTRAKVAWLEDVIKRIENGEHEGASL
jgi:DNA-binding PadR family transcriptional regulator